jgi:hypothetical protein
VETSEWPFLSVAIGQIKSIRVEIGTLHRNVFQRIHYDLRSAEFLVIYRWNDIWLNKTIPFLWLPKQNDTDIN